MPWKKYQLDACSWHLSGWAAAVTVHGAEGKDTLMSSCPATAFSVTWDK